MASKDAANNLPYRVVQHPQNEEYFHKFAIPKKDLKESREQHLTVSCTGCTRPGTKGEKLLRCSRCKTSSYCSKECQKKHWPIHKRCCVQANFSALKIINNFTANYLLCEFIQVCAILLFGLDKTPAPLDKPLIAECNVRMTPHLNYHMGLVTKSLSPAQLAEGTVGMPQLSSFKVDSIPFVGHERMELWKNIKKKNAAKFPNATVVIVDFHVNGSRQAMSAAIGITDTAWDMVKDGSGFEIESAGIPGLKKTVPLTIDSCLSFINKHIRSDERNQLSLRTHMTKEDIDEYRREIVDKGIDEFRDVDTITTGLHTLWGERRQ